jgi:sensor histidine kinase YesM
MIPLRPDPGKESGVVAAPLTGKRLFGVVLALATAIGFFSTLLLKLAIAGVGGSVSWAEAATGWIEWYIWAALTPLVVWLARTLPVSGRRWLHAVAGHALIGALICALELGLFAFVMTGYNELFMGHELAPWRDRYITLIGRWLPLQMLIYALIVAVVTAMEHGRRARERDVAAARLEAELVRTQVHALQAQIQPHFLFNALNTISSTMYQDLEAADAMLARLADLLRYALRTAEVQEVPLAVELDALGHYLSLLDARFGDDFVCTREIAPGAEAALVPSLILQPMVENAVRHGGLAHRGDGRVVVRAGRVGDMLRLEVEDDGPGMSGEWKVGNGVGLAATAERLRLLYGDNQRFEAGRIADGFRVKLELPWHER